MLLRLTPPLAPQSLAVAGSALGICVVKFTVADSEAMLRDSGLRGHPFQYMSHVTDSKFLLQTHIF